MNSFDEQIQQIFSTANLIIFLGGWEAKLWSLVLTAHHSGLFEIKNFFNLTVFENHPKVSFYIASEASYVYILSGKKFNKNAKIKIF